MNYDVNFFISKFEKIPESKWAVGTQNSHDGSRCALGWCNPEYKTGSKKEFSSLLDLFEANGIMGYFGILGGVARVNNGSHPNYQHPTPKQRILAALHDIKAMQQPQHADITKSIAVLPVEERADVILTPSHHGIQ